MSISVQKEARRYLHENRNDLGGFRELKPEVQAEVKRQIRAQYFVSRNADVEHRKEYLSPSGTYKLVITPYRTSKCWQYCQGIVYKAGRKSPLIEIRRNHHEFPYAWVESHASGSDYLVCSEDYYGQTVIDLKTLERADYAPDVMTSGLAFCWSDIHPSPDGKILAIEGGSWGSDYELRFYDFERPLDYPILPIDARSGYDSFIYWSSAERAKLSVGNRSITWDKPLPIDSLNWYVDHFSRWLDRGSSPTQIDTVNGALRLLSRLTEAEQLDFRDSFAGIILNDLIQTTYFPDNVESRPVTKSFIMSHELLMLQA